MCIDYRLLNAIVVKIKYPLPRIEEFDDQLVGANVFLELDLTNGYYRILIYPKDKHKTAFKTRYGHYQFNVMPIGLTNPFATFQALMQKLLSPFLDAFNVVYLDDILIYNKNTQDHAEHLKKHFKYSEVTI